MAPKYVVTLVHGTWPDTNGWVSRGSFLRRELQRRLGDTAFREFRWAGTNRHGARTEGGIRLAEFIRAGHAQHPDAQHFIVAHSHGGNVALYAMRNPAAHAVIDGIVTLATPFLSTWPRDPHRQADVMAWLTLTLTAVWLFMVLDALALPAFWWLLPAAFLIVRAKPALAQWLMATARLEQARIVDALQPPSIDRSTLLILCARGDEARRWLRAWEVVAQVPFVAGCVLLAFVDAALRTNVPTLIDGLAQRMFGRGLDQIGIFNVDGWAFWGVLIILCAVWGAALTVSSLLRWPGYWREPLLANVFVELRTRRTPDAAGDESHMAYVFDVSPQPGCGQGSRKGFRHSAICGHPAVATAISDWLADRSRPIGQE